MSNKEVRINVRTNAQTVEELKITAKLRGLTVSSLVNSLVVQAIRDEKTIAPEAFQKLGSTSRSSQNSERRSKEFRGDWRESLRKAKGIWKDRNDLPDFDKLRKEWSRDVWKEQE